MQYSETVVSVQVFGSRVRLIELTRDGTGSGYVYCKSGEKQNNDLHFWFIVSGPSVYSQCSQKEARELASFLSKSSSSRDLPKDVEEYVLPFKVGAYWGADPSQPKREDKFYQWNVEAKKSVAVPAGNFNDCYELVYQTLPDDEERWICTNRGLVADEYTHHGWVNHYRIELQSFTSGPKNRSKQDAVQRDRKQPAH